MSYDDTRPIGEETYPQFRPEDLRPTEAVGGSTRPGSALEPTVSIQHPRGARGPSVSVLTDTDIMERPSPVLAWLAVTSGSRRGMLYQVSPFVTAVGRDAQNDIIVDDPNVSEQHAKIKLERDENGAERFYIQDLATTNGTTVNGEEIVKQYLRNNDRVQIGTTTLVFKQIDESRRAREAAGHEEEPADLQGE